jgi:hypothetical protein
MTNLSENIALPPPPVEPPAAECCGRGCDPCIYDYYEKALNRWNEKYQTVVRHGNIQDQ